MHWLTARPHIEIPKGKRVILMIGGSGRLGKAFLTAKPPGVFVINITRKNNVFFPDVFTAHFDVAREPEKMIRYVATLTDSIDVLINAAAIFYRAPIDIITKEQFVDEFVVNTFTPIRLTQLCVQAFWSKTPKKENNARARKMINISSTAGFLKTTSTPLHPHYDSYAASKAALNVMTEYVQDYTSIFGVSSHVVAPYFLKYPSVMERTVSALWELQSRKESNFSIQKII